jgi:hypothetical protein
MHYPGLWTSKTPAIGDGKLAQPAAATMHVQIND